MVSGKTSGRGIVRHFASAVLAMALWTSSSVSQAAVRPEDAWVGSDAWRYLQAVGGLASTGRDSVPLPWVIDSAPRRLSFRGLTLRSDWNSDLPYGRADGSAWGGVGSNVQVMSVAAMRLGPLRVRLAPLAWWSANEAFRMIPAGPTPYSHAALGCCMDLPQRLGASAVARLDPGESEVELVAFGLRLAATSATTMVGPGREHTFLLASEAGGFPRLEAGVPAFRPGPWLGTFSGRMAWGRLTQTAWAPQHREGARLGTFLEGWWRSPGEGHLELGAGRFYHYDWSGWNTGIFPKLFGSIFKDKQVYEGGESDNQLIAAWGRLRIPEVGLEFSAELGKNDRSADLRDFGNELEHNSGWIASARKVWRRGDAALWAVDLSAASQRIPELELYRGQAFNYEHSPITQGHTQRGQLLGTMLLEGGGGGAMRVDRYTSAGRISVMAVSRSLANARVQAVPGSLLRQEWSLGAEWMTRTRLGEFLIGAAGVRDAGRFPAGGDARSARVTLGYRWVP